MSSIDKRVVEMDFDNAQFESGVKTSVNSLNDLKKGLDLSSSSKSLSDLNTAGKSFSLAGIAQGVESIASKFSALGIVGITVFQDLTNSAISLGEKMANALIGPIIDGGKERALAIDQAKFQFEGLGMDVDATMADALAAVKGTSYGLGDAALVASQLGASGMKAGDQMTSSLRAVAGVAAMTGDSYSDIGSIFTTVAGNGKLMGDQLLQLSDHGINAASAIAKFTGTTEANVRDMVSKGKISFKTFSDAMDSAFGKHAQDANQLFTGALANVHAALSRLGADVAAPEYENFRVLFNALIPVIDKIHASLMPLINDFNGVAEAMNKTEVTKLNNLDLSPIVPVIKSVENIFEGIQLLLEPIALAFRNIFPPATTNQVLAFVDGLQAMTEQFKMAVQYASDNGGLRKLYDTFGGLFAIFDIGRMAIVALFKGLFDLIQYLLPAGDGVLSFTGSIGKFLESLDSAIKTSGIFNTAIAKLGAFIKPVADGIKTAVKSIVDSFTSLGHIDTSGIDSFATKVKNDFDPFIILGEFVKAVFGAIVKVIQMLIPIFFKLASDIGEAFKRLRDNIVNPLSDPDLTKISEMINGGIFVAVVAGLNKFVNALAKIKGGFLGSITGILNGVRGCLTAYQKDIKADILLKIAISIGILALALVVLASIDPEKLAPSLAAMTAMLVQLLGSLAIFEKITSGQKMNSLISLGVALIGIAAAILILTEAMKNLSKLSWEGIAKGLTAIGVLLGELFTFIKFNDPKNVISTAIGLTILAAAMVIFAQAIRVFGSMSFEELTKGLGAMAIVLGELFTFIKFNDPLMVISTAVGITLLATAMVIFARAIGDMGKMSLESLAKGLGAMTIVLGELFTFIKFNDPKNVISTGLGLSILAAAMVIFAQAIRTLGSISLESLAKGLGALTIVLGELFVFIKFNDPTRVISTAIGLTILATAMVILSKALQNMGEMSWEAIAKGLTTLALSLGIIAVAMDFMTSALPGAAALLIISASLLLLAGVLKIFGGMSLADIGKSLLMLVGIFVVLGASAIALGPLVPIILALAVAVALLGVGSLAIGAGLLLFSAGLTALSIAGAAGAASLVLIVTALLGLIPLALQMLAEGIVAFAAVLAGSGPTLLAATTTLLLSIITAIVTITPKVADAIILLIETLLTDLANAAPQMLASGAKLIMELLQGIGAHIAEITEEGINVILQFMNGISSKLPDIIDTAFRVVISFINGLADAIRNNSKAIDNACANLIDAVVGALTSFDFKMADVGVNMIEGLIGGIKSMAGKVVDSAEGVVSGALNAAKKLLGIHSPSTAFAEVGMYSAMGLAGGLKAYSGVVATAAKNVGTTAMTTLQSAVSKISDVISGNIDMNPSIRPVLDLTDVTSGAQAISSLLSTQGISVTTSNSQASSIAKGMQTTTSDGSSANSTTQEATEAAATINIYGDVHAESKGTQTATLQQLQFLTAM